MWEEACGQGFLRVCLIWIIVDNCCATSFVECWVVSTVSVVSAEFEERGLFIDIQAE